MDKVLLSHGSGRGLQKMLETVILPSLIGESDEVLDAAVIDGILVQRLYLQQILLW